MILPALIQLQFIDAMTFTHLSSRGAVATWRSQPKADVVARQGLPRGVYPERDEILPLHFIQGQNDRKRRARNDIRKIVRNDIGKDAIVRHPE